MIESALIDVRAKVHQGVPIAQPLIDNDGLSADGQPDGEDRRGDRRAREDALKIADFYEDEVDAAIQSLTSIIEPVMMILVGMMVGVIVISMYLPMFKMLSLVK